MTTEPFGGGDMRARRRDADHIALDDHASTSAEPAHRIIATHLWTMLRTLRFTDGRVLAVGDAAAPLLGLRHTDTSFLSVVADITAAHSPDSQLSVRVGMPRAHDRFDVVIASLPYNDVRLQAPEHVIVRRAVQAQLALAMQRLTRAGGYTVLLASHDLMDHPFPEARRELHIGGDLLGAVRLPAGALRQLPGLDLPTDLLLLRRRPDVIGTRSQDFEHTTTIHIDGRDLEINTYFENNTDQVLGVVGADPLAWGPAAVTVSSTPDRLDRDLGEALRNITAHALRTRLTYIPDAARPGPEEPSVSNHIHQRNHLRTPTRPRAYSAEHPDTPGSNDERQRQVRGSSGAGAPVCLTRVPPSHPPAVLNRYLARFLFETGDDHDAVLEDDTTARSAALPANLVTMAVTAEHLRAPPEDAASADLRRHLHRCRIANPMHHTGQGQPLAGCR